MNLAHSIEPIVSPYPKVTFGIIVLNGEPFTRYCLRAIYPYAHQIVVVEGAASDASGISNREGHSLDRTLDVLREFKRNEDPERKVVIVTAEDEGHPNGFWPGEKHEMSQAYAKRASGDWLWQVDIDEFYHSADIENVLSTLQSDSSIQAMKFKTVTFWGGFDYLTDSYFLRRGAEIYHRLFRWAPGYRYTTHRPPTVVDSHGTPLTFQLSNVVLQHYSLLLPKQVEEKCRYYEKAAWASREKATQWAKETFLQLRNPYRTHNVYQEPGWIERFHGSHPEAVRQMRRALEAGAFPFSLRKTDDIERLLRSPWYALGRWGLKLIEKFR